MFCKTCGYSYEDPTSAYCSRCGAPKGNGNNYCENCGMPIQPGEKVCSNCGKAVQDSGPVNNQAYRPPVVQIQYREIALCIVFSIITCGIYSLYWFVQLTEDANDLSGDHHTSGGMALLFRIITCNIYGIYWAYKQGEKLDYAKQCRGIYSANSGLIYMILEIVGLGIIANALMQNEINRFATRQ